MSRSETDHLDFGVNCMLLISLWILGWIAAAKMIEDGSIAAWIFVAPLLVIMIVWALFTIRDIYRYLEEGTMTFSSEEYDQMIKDEFQEAYRRIAMQIAAGLAANAIKQALLDIKDERIAKLEGALNDIMCSENEDEMFRAAEAALQGEAP